MKLSNIAKLAMISAVVLTFALKQETAQAACNTATAGSIEAEVPYDINVCATIDNTFTVAVTDLDFGTVGATHKPAQHGCLIMTPGATGTLDESNATCSSTDADRARLVSDDQLGTSALISIPATGAFNTQEVRMLIQVDEEEMACTGTDSPPLIIGALLSDQTTPASWSFDAGADATARNTAAVYGIATTAADGALNIYIGGEIRTDATAAADAVYPSGTCEGTFNVTLFY